MHPFCAGRLGIAFSQHQHEVFIQSLDIYTQTCHDLYRQRIGFPQQRDQDMLCANHICAHAYSFLSAHIDHIFCSGRICYRAILLLIASHFGNTFHHLMISDILDLQRLRSSTFLHQCQSQQEMFCTNVSVPKGAGSLFGPCQHSLGFFCIILHFFHLPLLVC